MDQLRLAALSYLSDFPAQTIFVRFRDTRSLVFSAPASEVKVLLQHGLAIPDFNRKQELKALLLISSAAAARRLVRDARAPIIRAATVARRANKALHWPARHDKAKCGQIGKHTQLFIALDHIHAQTHREAGS